jgi:hypothetical protein
MNHNNHVYDRIIRRSQILHSFYLEFRLQCNPMQLRLLLMHCTPRCRLHESTNCHPTRHFRLQPQQTRIARLNRQWHNNEGRVFSINQQTKVQRSLCCPNSDLVRLMHQCKPHPMLLQLQVDRLSVINCLANQQAGAHKHKFISQNFNSLAIIGCLLSLKHLHATEDDIYMLNCIMCSINGLLLLLQLQVSDSLECIDCFVRLIFSIDDRCF